MSELRSNLVQDQELLKEQPKVKVFTDTQWIQLLSQAEKTRAPHPAKNIDEMQELIRTAILDYQKNENKTADAQVEVTYQKPDVKSDIQTISVAIEERKPGAFSQGAPMQGKVKNLKPILRETVEDKENPGYSIATFGYFYDNILSLTCWARTNKEAGSRALWLEGLMEEYAWFFIHSGGTKVLYQGRGKDTQIKINNNTFYGRPVLYFVRTENLRVFRQKQLEQISLRLVTIAQ